MEEWLMIEEKGYWRKITGKFQKHWDSFKRLGVYPFILMSISLFIMYKLALSELPVEVSTAVEFNNNEFIIKSILKEVAIALFILGSITIMLEFGDFTEFTLRKLTSIVMKDEYIERLDDGKLEELEKRIENKLHYKDGTFHEDCFYETIKTKITPLVKQSYYSKFIGNIECIIEDTYVKKITYKKMEITNPSDVNIKETLCFGSKTSILENIDDDKLYTITSFKIDSVVKAYPKIVTTPLIGDDEYNIEFNGSYPVEISGKGKILIEYTLESLVPLDDIHYINRVLKPCKEFHFTLTVDSEPKDYILTGNGFGFMASEKFYKTSLRKGLMLGFNDWILPGDGIIFTLQKKV